MVRIKTKEEIVRTLDVNNRNRGMSFDPDMVAYCGQQARVLRRVERVIDERTGRLLSMKRACIVLEDVTCRESSIGAALAPTTPSGERHGSSGSSRGWS